MVYSVANWVLFPLVLVAIYCCLKGIYNIQIISVTSYHTLPGPPPFRLAVGDGCNAVSQHMLGIKLQFEVLAEKYIYS